MTDKPLSSLELAKEMIALDADTLTAADTAQLQRLILDYGAVTLCGSTQPWGRKMRTWSQEQRASGAARLIGSGDFTNAATAALANGTAAHGTSSMIPTRRRAAIRGRWSSPPLSPSWRKQTPKGAISWPPSRPVMKR